MFCNSKKDKFIYCNVFLFVQGQDDYSIAVLPDEGTTIRQCESHLSFLSLLEVPKPLKYSISLDAVLNSQNKVNLEMENTDAYCLCIADMDIEKGKSQTPKTNDEPARKNEDPLAVSSILQYNMRPDLRIQMLSAS